MRPDDDDERDAESVLEHVLDVPLQRRGAGTGLEQHVAGLDVRPDRSMAMILECCSQVVTTTGCATSEKPVRFRVVDGTVRVTDERGATAERTFSITIT